MTLLSLHDAALPDALFFRLWRAVRGLGNERLRESYWTSFWFDLGPPRTLVDEAVLALQRRFPAVLAGVAGVEWWLGRTDLRRVPIELHCDRDNALFDRTGTLRHPAVSSVLYFNRVKGGALLVTDQRPARGGKKLFPEAPRDWAFAAPRPNRFVHFAGNLVHGVLDRNNAIPGKPIPGPPTPLRYALILNWWKRRPQGVSAWTGRVYSSLAARPVP